jgi:hypothetical protein
MKGQVHVPPVVAAAGRVDGQVVEVVAAGDPVPEERDEQRRPGPVSGAERLV